MSPGAEGYKQPTSMYVSLLRCATTVKGCDIGRVTIDILPDDIVLEIIDFSVTEADEDEAYEEWHILAHVCQKWRYVVFQSPLRLNLRILCQFPQAAAATAYHLLAA